MAKNQEDSFLPYEDKTGVDEGALSRLIDRMLSEARQECNQCREGNFEIMDAIDGPMVHPDYTTNPKDDPNTRRSRPKKTERRGRKGKKIDKQESKNTIEDAENARYSKEQSITLSMEQLSNMVTAETKSKARIIQYFYIRDWYHQNEDKVKVSNEIPILQDQCRELEQQTEKCLSELHDIKKAYSTVSAELNAVKKAKRSRRKTAKLRRSQQQAEKSVSSPNVEMSLIKAQNQTTDVTGRSDGR